MYFQFLFTSLLLCFSLFSFAQRADKAPRYFGDPIISDSSSAIMIPIRYNEALLSANKITLWSDFYSNILFYDYKTDTYKKLFDQDTYIKGFSGRFTSRTISNAVDPELENISSNRIFYFVKPFDYNNNGRIDQDDPSVLYVSDKWGNNLRGISPASENALSIEIFDKENFALIKMQRDSDQNKRFESKDKDFYYVRLNLEDLSFGKKIEVQ